MSVIIPLSLLIDPSLEDTAEAMMCGRPRRLMPIVAGRWIGVRRAFDDGTAPVYGYRAQQGHSLGLWRARVVSKARGDRGP
jgi:hypothetical protein